VIHQSQGVKAPFGTRHFLRPGSLVEDRGILLIHRFPEETDESVSAFKSLERVVAFLDHRSAAASERISIPDTVIASMNRRP
jgi:hypothetical protein